jgi:hypothetical protein
VRLGNQTDPDRCAGIILPSGNKSVSGAIESRQLCVVRVDETMTALQKELGHRSVPRFYSTGQLKSSRIQIGCKNWHRVFPDAAADMNLGTFLGDKLEASSRKKHHVID